MRDEFVILQLMDPLKLMPIVEGYVIFPMFLILGLSAKDIQACDFIIGIDCSFGIIIITLNISCR